jgi:hypothetical protein
LATPIQVCALQPPWLHYIDAGIRKESWFRIRIRIRICS